MRKLSLKTALAMLFVSIFFYSCDYEDSPINNSKLNQDGTQQEIASTNVVRKIIVLKQGASQRNIMALIHSHSGAVSHQFGIINAVAIQLPSNASQKALRAISDHADVLRVDDDIIISAPPARPPKDGGTPNPEVLPWGVDRIDAELVSGLGNVGSNVVKVGIVDTGIDMDHPDLVSNIAGGKNLIKTSKSYDDDNGHGTHVAGTVAALDNEIGVIGVAPSVKLYGVKVLDRSGSGYLSTIIAGLEWCINNDMDVVNMSLGTSTDVQSFHDAIIAVNNAGIVMVCAAGNDYASVVSFPARYSETIAVSATDINDKFASFSNKGSEIDLAAPGVNVYSTYKGGSYTYLNGTSMATPHVTGVVALILTYYTLTPAQVRTHLKATAENIGLSAVEQGAGLVDALNAVNTAPNF